MSKQPQFHHRQRGAILVISMLLLLVLTILAIAGSQSTRVQERMAGNSRDESLAFQGAEAGLRGGEEKLRRLDTGLPPNTCTAASSTCYVYQYKTSLLQVNLARQLGTWWDTNAKEYGVAGTQEVTGIVNEPHYVIEQIAQISDDLKPYGSPGGRYVYRVTAASVGGTTTAQAVVQSTFVWRYN